MARDTLLGFPAHTLFYRRRKFITLSTASEIAGAPAISFIKKDFNFLQTRQKGCRVFLYTPSQQAGRGGDLDGTV